MRLRIATEASVPRAGRVNGARAFSLVEILVVLGLIALLISLLLPAIQKARTQSKAVACQSNLRQIGQAMLIYANSNRGWLFPPEQGLIVPINERWFVPVLRPPPPLDPGSVDPKDWTPAVMLCPADDPDAGSAHSYLVNHHLVEHHVLYSSRPPAGLTPEAVVVAGEKRSDADNYYVEILGDHTTYFEQVEEYRHGRQLGSNYLKLDLHVDRVMPTKPGLPGGADPWDFPPDDTSP